MQYNTPYLNRDMGQEVADIAPESQVGSAIEAQALRECVCVCQCLLKCKVTL